MKNKPSLKNSLATLLTVILLLMALPVTTAFAATAANYPGTAVTGGGMGDAWAASSGTLVDALGADGGATANVAMSGNGASENLNMTNFGFSIPTGATIDGISVAINRYGSSAIGGKGVRDVAVQLFKAGSLVGDNKADTGTTWPTTQTTVATYGNATDLWGTTWTPEQINASNFGVTLDVRNSSTQSRTAFVDYVRITVTYTVPGTASTVTTQAVASIGTTTATGNGNVTSLGVPNPTAHGVVYSSVNAVPTTSDSVVNLGAQASTGAFTAPMTGLSPNTLYYVRAYATNTTGTSYGAVVQFTTAAVLQVTGPASVTYGATDTLTSLGGGGTGAVTYSVGASTGCSITGGATLNVTNASGTCDVTATKAADSSYIAQTSASFPVTLVKADATINVSGYNGVYDGAAHGATGTATGVLSEPLAGLNLGASFANVPGGTANWTFTDVTGNYNDDSGSVAIVITTKDLTVTAHNKSMVVGDPDPAFTFTAAGFVSPDIFITEPTCSVNVPHSTPGNYPIVCSGGDAGINYNILYVNGTLVVTAVDNPPTVQSITRASANPSNAASVDFTVTFSEDVTGVDAADFSLFKTGGITGESVTSVSGSGAVYTVIVNTGSGNGTLRLDIPDTATIQDLTSNPLVGLPYTNAEAYTIDKGTGSIPDTWVGGIAVQSDQSIVAVARPHLGSQIASYIGASTGSTTQYVPMLFKDAFAGGSYKSALYIQNLGNASASLTIEFINDSGATVHAITEPLAAKASKGY